MKQQHRGIILALALLSSAPTLAGEVGMAGGAIHFDVPDGWLGIMETQGDPEAKVFQVPDPSPTANHTLARVSVTVKQVGDAADYRAWVDAAQAKARSLTGYGEAAAGGPKDSYRYSAQEAGEKFSYVERYWLKGSRAVQLRCVRPTASEAGERWRRDFDQGCERLATQLNL